MKPYRIVPLVGLLAVQCVLARAASEPTTRADALVETCTARDLPLRTNNATGKTLELLRAFDVAPRQFQYTLQLIEEQDGIKVYRLVFPSPYNSPFPVNNVVPAEYYLPAEIHGRIPAAIVLDILHGNAVVPRGFAKAMAAQGMAAIYMPMAYYNGRRPADRADVRFLDADPNRATQPGMQSVMDIRRAKAILAARPEIDPARIGISGVSLGGIMTAMAAGIDGDFYRVVPILAGGDLAAITFHARETRGTALRLTARGINRGKFAKIMDSIEPLNFASRIDPRRCLMINAGEDEVIPKECTTALWQAAGKPTILWLPCGHYGAAFYMPTIRRTAIDFLKGKPINQLEFYDEPPAGG